MKSDDYSRKQKARDAEYEREYRAWIDSLPPDERRKLEAMGLAAPDLAQHTPMKQTLTLLALLAAGVIHLQAQQPTANETAWSALASAKKSEAATSPEAIALRNQILASSSLTVAESVIVAEVETARGGMEAYKATFREIAASAKTGDGVTRARANVKFWDGDATGWTNEMLALRPDLASALAARPTATPELKNRLWSVVKNRSAHLGACRAFFKTHRAKLSKAEQIEVTRTQKDLLLAIPTRDAAANAWLAEISADLVALQLDVDQ